MLFISFTICKHPIIGNTIGLFFINNKYLIWNSCIRKNFCILVKLKEIKKKKTTKGKPLLQVIYKGLIHNFLFSNYKEREEAVKILSSTSCASFAGMELRRIPKSPNDMRFKNKLADSNLSNKRPNIEIDSVDFEHKIEEINSYLESTHPILPKKKPFYIFQTNTHFNTSKMPSIKYSHRYSCRKEKDLKTLIETAMDITAIKSRKFIIKRKKLITHRFQTFVKFRDSGFNVKNMNGKILSSKQFTSSSTKIMPKIVDKARSLFRNRSNKYPITFSAGRTNYIKRKPKIFISPSENLKTLFCQLWSCSPSICASKKDACIRLWFELKTS